MAPMSHNIENSKKKFGLMMKKNPTELKIKAEVAKILLYLRDLISSRFKIIAAIVIEVVVKKSPHKK